MSESVPPAAMSEKAEARPLLLAPARRRRRVGYPAVAALTLLALLANFHWALTHETDYGRDAEKTWTWLDVKPSKELLWEPCYEGTLECARLEVPMDWQSPSDDKRVILGVVKLAAKTKGVDVPPFLMNPGGPGGSGITALRAIGPYMQSIVGDYHDIISWDPRGVGVSIPRADCWGSVQKRELWAIQETPVVDERPGLMYDAYSRAIAYSGVCERAMNETGILEHLSTASAARDMLEIVEKSGHKKLRYWGFSYGTVLAGVFASLYPDRVERMISDGNVGYSGYFEGDRARFVQDADSILYAFDEACFNAGPEKCELWSPSTKAITKRREDLLVSLRRSPVLVDSWATDAGPEMPVLITYSLLQSLTRLLIYKPLINAEIIARIYATLEQGDGLPFYQTAILAIGRNDQVPTDLLCPVSDVPPTQPVETGTELDAFPAIMCSDGELVDESPEDLVAYLDKILGYSKYMGAANILFHLPCVGRTSRPSWRVVPQAAAKTKTETPILFINNLHDNVTPLESAYNNSAYFPGSVVLKQNSLGHCSLAGPSVCTAKHIRAYVQDATLPAAETLCEQDYNMFETPGIDAALAQDELSSAVREMSERAEFRFGDTLWRL